MLKINLLPIRQLKKRAKAINQITSAVFVFFCILALLGVVGLFQSNSIKATQQRISVLQIEKSKYDKILRDIKKLTDEITELNRKIGVINTLNEESSLTVHIMDEVTKQIDNDRVWLTSFRQSGSTLTLDGAALDNESVAQFMDSLLESPYINNVVLGSSSLKRILDNNLKSFKLTCSVVQPPLLTEKDKSNQ